MLSTSGIWKRPLCPIPSFTKRGYNPQRQSQQGTTKGACRSWEISVASRKHTHSLEYILLGPRWTNYRTIHLLVCILFLNSSHVNERRQTLFCWFATTSFSNSVILICFCKKTMLFFIPSFLDFACSSHTCCPHRLCKVELYVSHHGLFISLLANVPAHVSLFFFFFPHRVICMGICSSRF